MSRYQIFGRLDASVPQRGTVVIDRKAGIFFVRPLGRHRTYTLPLSTVAEIVCSKVIKSEVAAKRASKRKA